MNIKAVKPSKIVLVHGEKSNMQKLKVRLDHEIRNNWPTNTSIVFANNQQPQQQQQPVAPNAAETNRGSRVRVYTPPNFHQLRFTFPHRIKADVVGETAVSIIDGLLSREQLLQEAGDLNASHVDVTSSLSIPGQSAVLVTENFQSKIVGSKVRITIWHSLNLKPNPNPNTITK